MGYTGIPQFWSDNTHLRTIDKDNAFTKINQHILLKSCEYHWKFNPSGKVLGDRMCHVETVLPVSNCESRGRGPAGVQ